MNNSMFTNWAIFVLVLLGQLLWLAGLKASAQNASAQKTIEWYRTNSVPLPRAQLVVEPNAPEKNIWKDARSRAAMAQLKYELATGTYWNYAKKDRDGVIAILDDPATRYIYTGKRSKLSVTAGAQTIDDRTVKVHHAAFSWDLGPNKDKLRPLYDIAETIFFHESVHMQFVRKGVPDVLQEAPVRVIARELGSARARFSPDALAELGRFVADPDAYQPPGPQNRTATTDSDEPDKPKFDPANLIAAFNRVQGKFRSKRDLQSGADQVCQKLKSAAEIEKENADFLRNGSLVPAIFTNMLRADLSNMSELDEIRASLGELDDAAADAGQLACEALQQSQPDLAGIRDAVKKAEKSARRADLLLAEARDVSADLISSLSNLSRIPPAGDFEFAVGRERKRRSDACFAQYEPWNAFVDEMTNRTKGQNLGIGVVMAKALAELQTAETENFENASTYRARYQEFESKYREIQQKSPDYTCLNTGEIYRNICIIFDIDLYRMKKDAVDEFNRARGDLLNEQSDQLARVSSAMSLIRRSAARTVFSRSAARVCIREAEAKLDRSDPQLTQEAADLGDSTALQCDVSDIDRRIALLRAAKFANVKTVPQLINALQGKRTAIQAATAKFDAAKALFNDGQPASTLRELIAARAELAKLGGAPVCATLAGRIDKGERQSQELTDLLSGARAALNSCEPARLREAFQNIGGKKKPQKLRDAALRIRQQLDLYSLLSQAGKLHRDKRFDQALDILRQAKRKRAGLGGNDCPVLGQRIDNAIASVQGQQGDRSRLQTAIESCNTRGLKQLQNKGSAITKAMRVDIADALEVCAAKEADQKARSEVDALAARRARCLETKGSGFYPSKVDSSGKYYCLPTQTTANDWCNDNNPGSGWQASKFTGKGGYSCVQNRKQRAALALAERKARCLADNGPGYHPGKPDANGEYFCLPNKRTANRWCNDNNPGSGWRAHKFTKNGGFSCEQNRRQRNTQARAECRQQARDTGKVYAYTKLRRDGTATCFTCDRGFYWKDGQCRSRTQRTNRPRGGGQQRGGGAQYACTYSNPDGSLLGGGASTSTIYTRRPISGARCVRLK